MRSSLLCESSDIYFRSHWGKVENREYLRELISSRQTQVAHGKLSASYRPSGNVMFCGGPSVAFSTIFVGGDHEQTPAAQQADEEFEALQVVVDYMRPTEVCLDPLHYL